MFDQSERSRLNRAERLSAVTERRVMTRIAAFCLVGGTLAVFAVSASGGANAGKDAVARTGGIRQIQVQQSQGNPNRPYIIGSVYNAKVKPGKSGKVRAPLH
jgi:hypothetical protein